MASVSKQIGSILTKHHNSQNTHGLSKRNLYRKCEATEHCANVHTKKTEHAVETDEEEELAEEESEDEG